ncbi:indoleamine 2-3-dioxygenase [Penicillium lagena]|uniref:indoleamine 2-3-dioxygenase n=1 Tax=Penicillium lagena TaxID=94218 RepID=UPI00253F9867|nr:indoleamine 2-3-dioxygenase [Penicillium lagena]KAJ5623847.1 indoleamine 2-3-dioxygenase [Penicillium lagena]
MYHPNPSHKEINGHTVTPKHFYVDQRTGFVPPQMPLRRLSAEWEIWEATLDVAKSQKLKAAEQALSLDPQPKIIEEEKARAWRKTVEKVRMEVPSMSTPLIDSCQMPVLSINNLKGYERELRRAHLVLAFIVQFYAHTVPSTEPITVPRSLTVPLLRVSKELQHAPYITYSDHALNNWSHKEPREEGALPTSDNLQAQITFTGTPDENEFHMTDIRVELKGAEAVELMRLATDEIVSSVNPNVGRITGYLKRAAAVIEQMKDVLMSTKKLVKPEAFYYGISPWLVGADADSWNRKWVWEGCQEVEGSAEMLTKISGPTAAQSPLVPTLDAYLGLEEDESKSAFLDRVRIYMICDHEAFLQHLRSNGRPIRSFVQKLSREQGADSPVVTAYDAAINAMKGFRDAHLIIVTLYVIIPAREAKARAGNPGVGVTMSAKSPGTEAGPEGKMEDERSANVVPGKSNRHTGKAASKGKGSQLMEFLKGFRDQTNHGRVG